MRIDRDEIMEALGLKEGMSGWLTPALIGFGVGALIGASMALMLAPKSGSQMRGDLMGKAREAFERAQSQVAQKEPTF